MTDKQIPNLYDDKNKILAYSQERFLKEGFYRLSVEEIARELGMSKSTLYKYFPTKHDLVNESIKNLALKINGEISGIINSDGNAVEKFVMVITQLVKNITRFTDKFMSDLQHHAPTVWEEVDEMRKKIMFKNISSIIIQGQEEELIIKYPPEIIITIIVGALRSVVNPQFLTSSKFSYNEAVARTFEILLNGILSAKGKKILKQLKLPK
jgi:AcrR family transcriptional regulator